MYSASIASNSKKIIQFIKAFNTDVSLKDIQDRYVLSHEDGITPEILESDVTPVLDELYKNIDTIVASYK